MFSVIAFGIEDDNVGLGSTSGSESLLRKSVRAADLERDRAPDEARAEPWC